MKAFILFLVKVNNSRSTNLTKCGSDIHLYVGIFLAYFCVPMASLKRYLIEPLLIVIIGWLYYGYFQIWFFFPNLILIYIALYAAFF